MQSRILVGGVSNSAYPVSIEIMRIDYGVFGPPVMSIIFKEKSTSQCAPVLQYFVDEPTTPYKIKECDTPTWQNEVGAKLLGYINDYLSDNADMEDKREVLRDLIALIPSWLRGNYPDKTFHIDKLPVMPDTVSESNVVGKPDKGYTIDYNKDYISLSIGDSAVITIVEFNEDSQGALYGAILQKDTQQEFSSRTYNRWLSYAKEVGAIKKYISYDDIQVIIGKLLFSK